MKKYVTGFAISLVTFGIMATANATLTNIGTATYDPDGAGGADPVGNFKLIWDNDNNGNSVVWLDYLKSPGTWSEQMTWAAGLSQTLTYNLAPGYSTDWGSNDWRLPSTVDADTSVGSFEYAGTSSEMSHLYHTDLSNTYPWTTFPSFGEFEHLAETCYWSSTQYSTLPGYAWFFVMSDGSQNATTTDLSFYGLALRTGQVTYTDPTTAPVPEPATMLLFGTGLAGLAAARRRKKAC